MTAHALFIAPSAYPLGGVAQWLDYLLPGLQTRGWRCTLGLTEGKFHHGRAYLQAHPWHDVCALANPGGTYPGSVRAVAERVAQSNADVVVVANVAAAYDAIRLLRGNGRRTPKLVMALHGIEGDQLADVGASLDILDGVVVVNRLAQQLVRGQGLQTSRLFYAPCGVPLPATPMRAIGLGDSELRILYCGRLESDQKRVLDLPDIARVLVDRGLPFHITVAGAGPAQQALRERIDTLGLAARFTLRGALPAGELANEYARHDALLITSRWETGPLVAWEAMACGLPVVSTSYIGSGLEKALVDGDTCLLYPVGDVQAAAGKLEQLRSPHLREQLRAGGLRLVEERYSLQRSIDAWHAALQAVMAQDELAPPTRGFKAAASGRLDRWLGAGLADTVRALARRQSVHVEPGNEWPHTLHRQPGAESFFAAAQALDTAHA